MSGRFGTLCIKELKEPEFTFIRLNFSGESKEEMVNLIKDSISIVSEIDFSKVM